MCACDCTLCICRPAAAHRPLLLTASRPLHFPTVPPTPRTASVPRSATLRKTSATATRCTQNRGAARRATALPTARLSRRVTAPRAGCPRRLPPWRAATRKVLRRAGGRACRSPLRQPRVPPTLRMRATKAAARTNPQSGVTRLSEGQAAGFGYSIAPPHTPHTRVRTQTKKVSAIVGKTKQLPSQNKSRVRFFNTHSITSYQAFEQE